MGGTIVPILPKLPSSFVFQVPYEIDDLEIEITEQAADSPLTRVMFNFDGDYSAVVGNDEQGNTDLFYPFDLCNTEWH